MVNFPRYFFAGIAVLLQRVSKPAVTVGVDGSLYRYHPRFHQLITEKITQLAPNKQVGIPDMCYVGLSHD